MRFCCRIIVSYRTLSTCFGRVAIATSCVQRFRYRRTFLIGLEREPYLYIYVLSSEIRYGNKQKGHVNNYEEVILTDSLEIDRFVDERMVKQVQANCKKMEQHERISLIRERGREFSLFIAQYILSRRPCPGGSVLSVSDSRPGGCEFEPRLRRLLFPAYFRLSPLQEHVRKVVGGFGRKSCVSTDVRKPGNTYTSPTTMI